MVTEGRFTAVDTVLERLFKESGIQTDASLTSSGDTVTLRVKLDFSRELEERDTPLSKLLDDFDLFQFVLVEGRFGPVNGFDVTEGSRATLSKEWLERAEKAYDAKGALEFALTWNVR